MSWSLSKLYSRSVSFLPSFLHFFLPSFLSRLYLFIFREKGREGGEGEKHPCERHINRLSLQYALTGDPTRNPGTCPDLSLCGTTPSPLKHCGQGCCVFTDGREECPNAPRSAEPHSLCIAHSAEFPVRSFPVRQCWPQDLT